MVSLHSHRAGPQLSCLMMAVALRHFPGRQVRPALSGAQSA